MSLLHNYSLKRFDPARATITVLGLTFDTVTQQSISYTRVLPLPVNTAGAVPEGPALYAYIDQFLNQLMAPELAQKSALALNGGLVSNRASIFTLTTDQEGTEPTGRPVTLYADQDFRNPATNEVTRTVMRVNTLDENNFGLDNGNIGFPANLTNIVSEGFSTNPGPVTINANYSILSSNLPAKFIQQFGGELFGSPAFDGTCRAFYIEHPPIQMYSQAQALFNYN